MMTAHSWQPNRWKGAARNMRKTVRQMVCLLGMLLIAGICAGNAQAKTTSVTVKAAALQKGLQYTLSKMPYNGMHSPVVNVYGNENFTVRSVQDFAITPDQRYIFTVSEGHSGSLAFGRKHTVLARCAIPAQKGQNARAVCQEAVILDNYGHGETIAVTQSDLGRQTYNIWVACTPNSVQEKRLGTDIARLTYKVVNGKGKITKKVILTNFARNGKTLVRDRVGVAVDEKSQKIAFRIRTKTGTFYEIYDLKKLEKKLNKVKNNKKYNMSKAEAILKADIQCSLIPKNAYQSFDIDGKYLYICGGNTEKGAGIYKVPYKTYKNGKATPQELNEGRIRQIIEIIPKIKVDGKLPSSAYLEIEGMKVFAKGAKTDYYVNFFMKKSSIRNAIGIYKFTK